MDYDNLRTKRIAFEPAKPCTKSFTDAAAYSFVTGNDFCNLIHWEATRIPLSTNT